MIDLLLDPVSTQTLLVVIAIVAVLAVVFAVFIVLVSKLCAVPSDEKAEKIQELLANANCGGCGYAGCSDFAKALSSGKAQITSCGPTSAENKAEISKILGVSFAAGEEKFAVVKCAGGNIALDKFDYVGNEGCAAQSSFMSGRKICSYGCLGGGSCAKVCPYHAVSVKEGVACVNYALCEACGLCVNGCPKKVIELLPKSAAVYVACSSQCKGKTVMDACKVGCIACGMCAKVCPFHAITMVNNLPVIDYEKCTGCYTCFNKCPRKCIKKL